MKKITKVVIPAAGYGTRFLPATKAQPKEMLPIVDKPIIQYVVEEAVNSGIKDIIIVTNSLKRSLEDHFDYSFELEHQLKEGGKLKEFEEVRRIAKMANFIYIRQKGPYGNATPVISAAHILDNEPFAVLWGDEFIYSNPPRLKQLLDVYDKYHCSVISAVRIPDKNDVSKYGIAEIKPVKDNVYQIMSLVEKPKPEEAPSNLATHGGYVFTPGIFKHLKDIKPGKAGEIWLVDAIKSLMQEEKVYACEIKDGHYYDTGNKLEYLKANIDFALQRDDLRQPLLDYLKTIKK
ncbi:MAG: UTP--glucose-1-phosphate uridylyltransferase GalU [Patescibacteria group bacterium]|jgi:UTP--glucose-1-phosphate uridylyltransferase